MSQWEYNTYLDTARKLELINNENMTRGDGKLAFIHFAAIEAIRDQARIIRQLKLELEL